MKLRDLTVGQRVQMHPATDTWMQGDRYGQVISLGRIYAKITMDRSGRTLTMLPEHLLPQ